VELVRTESFMRVGKCRTELVVLNRGSVQGLIVKVPFTRRLRRGCLGKHKDSEKRRTCLQGSKKGGGNSGGNKGKNRKGARRCFKTAIYGIGLTSPTGQAWTRE